VAGARPNQTGADIVNTVDAASPVSGKAAKRSTFWPLLFCFSMTIPLVIELGSLRMSPYRILLLLMLVPSLIGWLNGKGGKKIPADYFMILFAGWSVLSIFMTMGFAEAYQPAGMFVIETLGAYFLARTTIRDEKTFRSIVKTLIWIAAIMLPFAVAESLLHRPVALQLFSVFGKVVNTTNIDPRLGLRRAQVVFEHPIIYGVFCSSTFALGFYVFGSSQRKFGTLMRAGISVITTFVSLSTGAFLSLVVQSLLTIWDFAMRKSRRKWTILTVIVVFLYLLVDALSNRTPAEVFITYLTFNLGASYNRVLIWRYGTEQVYMTPWFGTGISDNWSRPDWMHASMDNFWLVITVRHGVPALLMLIFAYFGILRRMGRTVLTDANLVNIRKGLIFVVVGISVSICTVHLWGASFSYFFFLLGSGVWLCDHGENKQAAATTEQAGPESQPVAYGVR
jgi:hypothetical protein